MHEFCGWIGRGHAEAVPQHVLENMLRGLQSDSAQQDVASCATGAVSAPQNRTAASYSGELTVAVLGAPWWQDDELQAAAGRRGIAESVLRAYRQHGDRFLAQLRGHFAIAISDSAQGRGLLAVDRFGNHRLCYTETDAALVFGTTLTSVRGFPGTPDRLNRQAIFDYLYFHMIPSPQTVFADIHKLEPGHVLVVDGDSVTVNAYWEPDFSVSRDSIASLHEELHATLKAAVARAIGNIEGKVGAFLSGGLDSSTVCGVLAGQTSGKARAYSIGFAQEGYDEMAFARTASRHFDLDLHEYYVTPVDIADAIPTLSKAYDEPFGNSSAVPAYFCAKMARADGIDCLLAGDGGDELFAGNERYARQLKFDLHNRLPQWIRKSVLEPVLQHGPIGNWNALTRKARSYLEQANIPMPLRLQSYNFLQRTPSAEVFDPEFLSSISTDHPSLEMARVWNSIEADTLVNQMLFLDWKFTLADNDLRKVNRMCQQAGIGVEYPMLDDDLLDFSLKIPSSQKLKNYELRHFFKEAMQDFLPAEIINKTKQGFGLPFGEWLKTSAEVQELVYGSLQQLKSRKVFRDEFIDDLVAKHRSGHASYYGEFVWVMTMLEQWLAGNDQSIT